jgi:hypothetical protein
MAEMKIKSGPLKLTVKDDRGRVVAALRYPKVRWTTLEIESEDEVDAVVVSDRRVRLVRRVPSDEAAGDGQGEGGSSDEAKSDWDPFREFEYGVRDLFTKAGRAVEDFLADLNEWSGPIPRPEADDDGDEEDGEPAPSGESRPD